MEILKQKKISFVLLEKVVMISLQIISTKSGKWDVDWLPTGDLRATSENYDGAEDSLNDDILYGTCIDDLMDSVRLYDQEYLDE